MDYERPNALDFVGDLGRRIGFRLDVVLGFRPINGFVVRDVQRRSSMSLNFRLTEERFNRISPLHPDKPRGVPSVDDRCVLSGIVFRLQRGFGRSDGPGEYGPAKTLYNRYKHRSEAGVFERIFEALAREGADPDTLMIDASHIETHRIAASGVKKTRATGAPTARPKAG